MALSATKGGTPLPDRHLRTSISRIKAFSAVDGQVPLKLAVHMPSFLTTSILVSCLLLAVQGIHPLRTNSQQDTSSKQERLLIAALLAVDSQRLLKHANSDSVLTLQTPSSTLVFARMPQVLMRPSKPATTVSYRLETRPRLHRSPRS